jgi:hypothetical protein
MDQGAALIVLAVITVGAVTWIGLDWYFGNLEDRLELLPFPDRHTREP